MRKLLALFCLVLFLIPAMLAQRPGGGGGGSGSGRRATPPPRTRVPSTDLESRTTVFLSGKVIVDDGSALTEPARIQTICRGQKRTETHTDSRGNFSFQFGSRFGSALAAEYDADTDTRTNIAGRPERRNLGDCELQAALSGFTSEVVHLGGRFTDQETADVGRIVLHRLANVQGFTISATTAAAPGPARKAFEKGQEQSRKSKWIDAQKSFEKAVSLYPKFAAAWFELGLVQLNKNDPVSARSSFQQSLAADPKFVSPYRALTQIAMHDRNWRELIDFTDRLLALDPVSFPEAWLSSSIGHYYLQQWDAAEKSARRGLTADTEHRVPRLEYLLGMVLLQKPDYQEASQHLRAFLNQSTRPEDKAEAQKQLDQVARLSAATSPSSRP